MRFKEGVYLQVSVIRNGVQQTVKPSGQIIVAWTIADEVAQQVNKTELLITSVLDGTHGPGSKHYTGDAFDARKWEFGSNERVKFRDELKRRLGRDFDVIEESDHFHIEYDPK